MRCAVLSHAKMNSMSAVGLMFVAALTGALPDVQARTITLTTSQICYDSACSSGTFFSLVLAEPGDTLLMSGSPQIDVVKVKDATVRGAAGSFLQMRLMDFQGTNTFTNVGSTQAQVFQVGMEGVSNLDMTNDGALDVVSWANIGSFGGNAKWSAKGGAIAMFNLVLGDFARTLNTTTGIERPLGRGEVSFTDIALLTIKQDLQIPNGVLSVENTKAQIDKQIQIATSGGTGKASVTKASEVAAQHFELGQSGGKGTLLIADSKVSATEWVSAGIGESSQGEVIVEGKEVVLELPAKPHLSSKLLRLGHDKATLGSLKAAKGAYVEFEHAYVGATGGTGKLNIEESFARLSGELVIGSGTDSNGEVTVLGTEAEATYPVTPHLKVGFLYLGRDNTASAKLAATQFAHVAVTGTLATHNNATALLERSLLTVQNSVHIGESGSTSSSLTLDRGSRLSGPSDAVTPTTNYPGVGFLAVGHQGQGKLDVNGGSQVIASILSVGHDSGAVGTLNISGSSLVHVTQDLLVGYRGNGIVNVGTDSKLLVGKYLAIGFEGKNSVLNVRNGGVVELLHYPGEKLVDRISIGRMATGGGALFVDKDSTLLLQGDGNLLSVYRGTAEVKGTTKIELDGKTQMLGLGEIAGNDPSTLTMGGRVEVAFKAGYTPVVGDFFPLFNARSISMGSDAKLGTYTYNSNGTFDVRLGDVMLNLAKPDEGRYLALERLKVNDGDIFGVRVVDQAIYLNWNQGPSTTFAAKCDTDNVCLPEETNAGSSASAASFLSQRALASEVASIFWGNTVSARGAGGNTLGNSVPIPILESSPSLPTAPTNALDVRFAHVPLNQAGIPTVMYGKAWDVEFTPGTVIDIGNRRKDGEVVVFVNVGRSMALTAIDVAHEAGHGLGLVHTSSPGAVQVMDYFDSPGSEYFWTKPIPHTENLGNILYPYMLGWSQNAVYDLLAYSLNWSETEIAAFGGQKGSLTLLDFMQGTLEFKLNAPLATVFDLAVQVGMSDEAGASGWASVFFAQEISAGSQASIAFRAFAGLPVRVVASSDQGGLWDLRFAFEGEEDGSAILAGETKLGRVLKHDPIANSYVTVGQFALSSETIGRISGDGAMVPVPEPSAYAMLLAGIGAVIFIVKRRHRWG